MTVPAGFSIIMAAVVLAGVGAGFAIGPRPDTPTRAAAIEVPTTILPAAPASTTTAVRVPVPACRLLSATQFTGIRDPAYIAGTDESLLLRMRAHFEADVTVLVLGPTADLRSFVPAGEAGVLLIRSSNRTHLERARALNLQNMKVILYSDEPDISRTSKELPSELLVVVDDAASNVPFRGNERYVANLITEGATASACPL